MKQSVTRYKQKTEIFPVTRPPTWLKFDSCFWFQRQDKKGIKTSLQLSLYELYNYFHVKISTARKTFTTQCFFIDLLNHKTVNKGTCRTLSGNPLQL